jgi:hypothetical protein
MINLIKGSLQDELDQFFRGISQTTSWQRIVSKSAFCRARKKLNYSAFIELNQVLNRFFYKHFPVRTWQGFSLMAIDGSTVGVPTTPENMAFFGGQKKTTMARVSQMFDVLNKVTVHALIEPLRIGEREMASEHLLYLRSTDLILLDRGYPAFWLFKMILTTGGQFCARISPRVWKQVGEFQASDEKEKIIWIKADPLAKRHCRELGLDHEPIMLRLIRIGPDDQILITSLTDGQAYPVEIFNDLYHKRWPVESDYNVLKNKIAVERWTGRSVMSVYQDFYAKVFSKNLAAVLIHPVQEQLDHQENSLKYRYQVNWTQAISKCKDSIAVLFQSDCPYKLIVSLQEIFKRSVEPIRPGRKHPRNKNLLRSMYKHAYKPVR